MDRVGDKDNEICLNGNRDKLIVLEQGGKRL